MTAGNRHGLKMYSFNTTVRMPDKNIEFLTLFKEYEERYFDKNERLSFYQDAIKRRIVVPKKISVSVREKIREGKELSDSEIQKVLEENVPPNGFSGRVGDFLSAMASQGFIQKQNKRYRLTNLGNDLIENPANESDIYIKSMLGLQYGSIDRFTAKNKAIPFLNTLFVIHGLNEYYRQNDLENPGLSDFEFGVFVLTMTNCNYQKTIQEILTYRKLYLHKNNFEYAMDFVRNQRKILEIQKNTLYGSASYTDEVLRKFRKTSLFTIQNRFRKNYILFSEVEEEKVHLLIQKYQDYRWEKYTDLDTYFYHLETKVLPWEKDDSLYVQILKKKAELIGFQKDLRKMDCKMREEIEKQYNDYVFKNYSLDTMSMELICQELQLINGRIRGKSILPDTENYIKLEWFSALLLSKQFGQYRVQSNLSFFDDGTPRTCAGGNEADIGFSSDEMDYNIEVTTISNKQQQMNYETTSVLRHLAQANKENTRLKRAVFIAPYIHYDTIQIYRLSVSQFDGMLAVPITIDAFIKAVLESESVFSFDEKIQEYYEHMIHMSYEEFEQYINSFDSKQYIN